MEGRADSVRRKCSPERPGNTKGTYPTKHHGGAEREALTWIRVSGGEDKEKGVEAGSEEKMSVSQNDQDTNPHISEAQPIPNGVTFKIHNRHVIIQFRAPDAKR